MRRASPRSPRARPPSSDHGRGRASAITIAPATHPRGTRSLDGNADRCVRACAQPAVDRLQDFLGRDRVHHALVHGAAAAMTGGAERAAADGDVRGRPGTVARGVGGPEDPHHGRPRPRRRDGGDRCPRPPPAATAAPARRIRGGSSGSTRRAAPSEAATTRSASFSSPGPQLTSEASPRSRKPMRDASEELGRPELARPAPAGIQDDVAVPDRFRLQAGLDARRHRRRGRKRELAETERGDAHRTEEREVLVDDVHGLALRARPAR